MYTKYSFKQKEQSILSIIYLIKNYGNRMNIHYPFIIIKDTYHLAANFFSSKYTCFNESMKNSNLIQQHSKHKEKTHFLFIYITTTHF